MAGEWQFALQREDAHAIIGARQGRRQQEGGLRQVQPARDRLHLFGIEALGIGDHRQRIAGEIVAAEDVDELEGTGHDRLLSVSIKSQ